jgi:hypothetical protein
MSHDTRFTAQLKNGDNVIFVLNFRVTCLKNNFKQ